MPERRPQSQPLVRRSSPLWEMATRDESAVLFFKADPLRADWGYLHRYAARGNLQRIELSTGRVLQSFQPQTAVRGISFSSEGSHLFAWNDKTLFVLDYSTLTVVATVERGLPRYTDHVLEVEPGTVFAMNTLGKNLVALNWATAQAQGKAVHGCGGMVLQANGRVRVLAGLEGKVWDVDPRSLTKSLVAEPGLFCAGLCLPGRALCLEMARQGDNAPALDSLGQLWMYADLDNAPGALMKIAADWVSDARLAANRSGSEIWSQDGASLHIVQADGAARIFEFPIRASEEVRGVAPDASLVFTATEKSSAKGAATLLIRAWEVPARLP